MPGLGTSSSPLEKGMTTHSCILAWRSPWTEEPGRLQSMGFFYKQQRKTNFKDNSTSWLVIDYLLYCMNSILVSLSAHTHIHTQIHCSMAICSWHIITSPLTFQYLGGIQGVGPSLHLHLARACLRIHPKSTSKGIAPAHNHICIRNISSLWLSP